MSNAPLMPKATAVWLVDNTALTFDQVADFTKMHPLEVRAIADGDAAQGIKGMDPISTGQLTRDEIERGEKDPNYRLRLGESKVTLPPAAKKKGPRYTPVSRRHERPSAILWLVRNHPELKDAQIMRLVGTTKTTIARVRDRTHWNASTLTPMDPVTLGLCSQIELDFEVQRAAKEKPVPAAYGGATCCRPPRPPRKSRNSSRPKRSARTSTSTPCSPSSRRSAARSRTTRSRISRTGAISNAAVHPAAFLFGGARPAGLPEPIPGKPCNVLQKFVRQKRFDQDRNAMSSNRVHTSERMSPVMTMAGTFQASAARSALTVSTPLADPRRL